MHVLDSFKIRTTMDDFRDQSNRKRPRRLFSHPTEAMGCGEREELLYVACSHVATPGKPDMPDFLATVDVNPESETYGKVIHRLTMPHVGDELSHLGWNTCMSCYGEDADASHDTLIVTSLKSSNIYLVNVANPRAPLLGKVIGDDVIRSKSGLTRPGCSHCLGFGKVMISGHQPGKDNQGGFIEFSVEDEEVTGRWDSGHESNVFAQDFWYQLLTHNVIASTTGLGRPHIYDGKTSIAEAISHAENGELHLWDFEQRTVVQTVDLGRGGAGPCSVRFLHDAEKPIGFVSSLGGTGIFKFWKNDAQIWEAKKVIEIPMAQIERLASNSLPAMSTDMVLSLDDNFLFCSNWLLGDIRQYDVRDTDNPRLVGQLNLRPRDVGNLTGNRSGDAVLRGDLKVSGGPGHMTLSLDGSRLYVTTSLFSEWDADVYPETVKNGSVLLLIDVNLKEGGLSLNQEFVVDFAGDDGSSEAVLAKEMRIPGGDCTSDIFLSLCSATPKKT